MPNNWIVKNNSPKEPEIDLDDITIGRYINDLEVRFKEFITYYSIQQFCLTFQQLRQKKLFFNLPYRFIPKRTPSGFMGMRGKKFLEASMKRGPSGFMGMRGKKSYPDPLMYFNEYEDDFSNEFEKRSPAGFFGMRGKKESEYYRSSPFAGDFGGAKRSPKMGFHGMRGKRSTSNNYGLFGTMKRNPNEFRRRFLGVRGKKSDYGLLDEDDFEKRSPNGFMGMRGKKS